MKAVLDGKQVAVLVPTTILASSTRSRSASAWRSSASRRGLSRFRTGAEARQIIEAAPRRARSTSSSAPTASRNKKVEFRDLGLLIVDEEQRFGVTHKEKIKRLKNDIDVLTLSATPIPRTLQMSLLGHPRPLDHRHPAARPARRAHPRRQVLRRGHPRGDHARAQPRRAGLLRAQPRGHHRGDGRAPRRARPRGAHRHRARADEGVQAREGDAVDYINGEINVLLCSSDHRVGPRHPQRQHDHRQPRRHVRPVPALSAARPRRPRAPSAPTPTCSSPRAKLKAGRREAPRGHPDAHRARQRVPRRQLRPRDPRRGQPAGDDQSGHVTAVGLDLYNELLEEASATCAARRSTTRSTRRSTSPWPASCPRSTSRRRACG